MNIGIQVSVSVSAFNSFEYFPRNGADHMVWYDHSMCTFWGTTKCFPQGCSFVPTNTVPWFQFSHIFTNVGYLPVFQYSSHRTEDLKWYHTVVLICSSLMTSPPQWTWVWVNSGSWWWTGRPGVLRFMGLQRVGQDWATELNWTGWLMMFEHLFFVPIGHLYRNVYLNISLINWVASLLLLSCRGLYILHILYQICGW